MVQIQESGEKISAPVSSVPVASSSQGAPCMPVWNQLETRKEMISTTDHQERERVRSRIGSLVMRFCQRQLGPFHMEQLLGYVESHVDGRVAPDSPGRILRLLQEKGELGYRVVDRTRSLYEILWVGQRPAEQAELFAARAS